MGRVKNLNFFPRLSADQLHPDEGEEQQQAGNDQHLLQSISLHFLFVKSCHQSIQVIGQSHREQERRSSRQGMISTFCNQSIFYMLNLPSINRGYWTVPQRVGEELQQAGDDQQLLQSISLHFLIVKSCHQSIQVIGQSHREQERSNSRQGMISTSCNPSVCIFYLLNPSVNQYRLLDSPTESKRGAASGRG